MKKALITWGGWDGHEPEQATKIFYDILKNEGYDVEHAYSENTTAIKNCYLLLQIAHILSQLMEHGKALAKHIRMKFGSIRNIARRLLESLRNTVINCINYDKKQLLVADSS